MPRVVGRDDSPSVPHWASAESGISHNDPEVIQPVL